MRTFQRFIEAQELVWSDVLNELAAGKKETHWMWFVFPQPPRDGTSEMSQRYALTKRQARRYLRNPLLSRRLYMATALVVAHLSCGTPIEAILGEVDALKFRSSMELFESVSGEPAFRLALSFLDSP